MARTRLTLYYRDGCHLCDVMVQALRGLQSYHGFELELVDVDRDPALLRRYDEKVPVLCHGDRELCHYRLDQALVQRVLEAGG